MALSADQKMDLPEEVALLIADETEAGLQTYLEGNPDIGSGVGSPPKKSAKILKHPPKFQKIAFLESMTQKCLTRFPWINKFERPKNPCIPKPVCDVVFGVSRNLWVG